MLDETAAVAAPRQPTLADSERELILQALESRRWRIKGPAGAAAALGLNPSTLYSRMKKLGIRPPGPAEDAEERLGLTAHHRGPSCLDSLRRTDHVEPAGSHLSYVAGRLRARGPGARSQRMRRQPGESPGRRLPQRGRAGRRRRRASAAARLRVRAAGGSAASSSSRSPATSTRWWRAGSSASGSPPTGRSTSWTRGVQRGAAYEMGQAFEDYLNKKLKTKTATKVNVVFVPLPRDQLAHGADRRQGRLVVAQVIVRPELQAMVDFTNPVRTNVSEVVVTGPGAPAIASVDDLSGKDVYARKDSSAWQSLVDLNQKLEAKGRPPVAIREVPGNLEDDDLLEMANAGIIPAVVVHDYLAEFWKKVFTNLTVHETVTVRTGASLAVPFRKNSPQLAAELNAFLAKNGLGTAFGNVIEKRYLVNTTFAK